MSQTRDMRKGRAEVRLVLATLLGWMLTVSDGAAEVRRMVLAVDADVVASGLVDWLVPRFALKHAIRAEVVTASTEDLGADADAVIAPDAAIGAMAPAADARPAFHVDGGGAWSVAVLAEGQAGATARLFRDWLTGEVGQRTVASFPGPPRYLPGALQDADRAEARPSGEAGPGLRLALVHCGRCHVVGPANRMGGIGSSPSFAALRAIPDWEAKFAAFWTANPHPSFTQVEGMTQPFARAPHIAPVELTLQEAQAIAAYAATIAPKDLGQSVQSR